MFCEKFRWIFNNGINDQSQTMLYSHYTLNDKCNYGQIGEQFKWMLAKA